MQTKLSASGTTGFHVVGPDLDNSLVRALTVGDEVLVEINGEGQFRTNPITAAIPFKVVEATDDHICVSHPQSDETIKLPFAAIRPYKGPAVFRIDRPDPNIPYWLVMLQFVAYRTKTIPHSYNPADYIEHFSDPVIKRGLLKAWCNKIATLVDDGNNFAHGTAKRFALRALISPGVVDFFKSRNWRKIDQLPIDTLLQIARELEYLPTFMEQEDGIRQHTSC